MSYRTVSADSHVYEPPDLWEKRIEARYRERAPRVVRGEQDDIFVFEDFPGYPVGAFARPFFREGPAAHRFEEGQRGVDEGNSKSQDLGACAGSR